MNVERLTDDDDEQLEEPLFLHDQKLAKLERQLYGHVLAAIDFDAISSHEEHIALILRKDFAMAGKLALDLSTQMITAAMHRAIADPARHMSFGPPEGITAEEAAAVAYDETCELCLVARQRAEKRSDHERPNDADDADDEPCECCEMVAQEWRTLHKATLVKAGLWPRPTADPS